ncbi:hypothetical protein RIF29_12080 [Crotalaria pallida]|uniref:50S ribosomal protein 6, chloroplastic n=1 Tax=Crotalaria pallida TaxID=3830 RepID=A0AAN9IMY9_CROPI
MSVSAIFGTRVVMMPSNSSSSFVKSTPIPIRENDHCGFGMVIECSSRPKKKGTAHHIKTRPRKTQPWDIKRKPTVYPPLPPLPPEWSVVISADAASTGVTSPPPPPAAAEAEVDVAVNA